MRRVRVIYIVSEIDKALAFEWIATGLNRENVDPSFILLNRGPSQLESFLTQRGIPVKRIKAGASPSYFPAFIQLLMYLIQVRPHVVHCHLRTAELVGITASFLLRIPKRIYTRHNSTYNHLYHPKGVWIDKMISAMATDIVVMSKNVLNILTEKEGVRRKKIHLIHHGFDIDYFQKATSSDVSAIKNKYGIPTHRKVIGIVARYTWWKGYAYSIPAIGKFLKNHPDYFLALANAKGNNRNEIKKLLDDHLNKKDYTEIDFEEDLPALYGAFDIYVHVPFDATVEAFGQTYVEALICGVPSVFTLSGVAPEFIQHEKNALVVDFKDSRQIEDALNRLSDDPGLRYGLISQGAASIQQFGLSFFLERLESLYLTHS